MSEAGHERRGGWRFPTGLAIFVIGFAAPALIPLVVASELPTAWKTALSGVLAFGFPELMMVAATAILGKAGFAELKRRIGAFFRRYGPPDTVGPTRYRIGLVLFSTPLLLAWLSPYVGRHLPGFDSAPLAWHIGGDVVFLTSLLVLGGDFWDKLRSLFVQGAKAVFPSTESS